MQTTYNRHLDKILSWITSVQNKNCSRSHKSSINDPPMDIIYNIPITYSLEVIMSVSNNKTCRLLEQYISYLSVMKGRSDNTIDEYQNDLAMFFRFIKKNRNPGNEDMDLSDINIEFIKSITIHEMYCFIAGSDKEKKLAPSTRTRRIVSIRQFWKYLKTKAHLIDNNIARGVGDS
jgi:hypothetical protein